MGNLSLKGIIDMHVHSSPDIRERAYTDFDLMKAAVRVGARAVVLKSHHGTTMNRAYLTNLYNRELNGASGNNFEMIGSVTLNYAIGGLNPTAVETAIKMGAKVVWLPTTSSSNHLAKYGKSGGIECVVDGKAAEPLRDILTLIRDSGAVLGTGHVSAEEAFVVIEEAKKIGVNKIVVTHPEFWVTEYTLEQQIKAAKEYGAILERCFAQPMGGGVYKSNLADNLAVIKEVGYEHVMVDTDGGQVENPLWEIALEKYMQYLLDNGIPEEHVYHMTRTIPAGLLDLL